MIIAMVRHGETDWNRERRWQGRSDIPLNELGRRQASAAAPLLADRSWAWMITSPLERAQRTAQIIADLLPPVPITIDEQLVEQDYGAADGVPTVEAAERWPDGDIPGLEAQGALRRRAARALEGIAGRMNEDGIVVSHGGVIRAAFDELCGMDTPRILNGAVSLIEHGPDGWRAVEVNIPSHLAHLDAGGPANGLPSSPTTSGRPIG